MSKELDIVVKCIREVMAERGLRAPELTADQVLDSSLGANSLVLAEVIVRLERATGQNPFARGPIPTIRTVADLAALYRLR